MNSALAAGSAGALLPHGSVWLPSGRPHPAGITMLRADVPVPSPIPHRRFAGALTAALVLHAGLLLLDAGETRVDIPSRALAVTLIATPSAAPAPEPDVHAPARPPAPTTNVAPVTPAPEPLPRDPVTVAPAAPPAQPAPAGETLDAQWADEAEPATTSRIEARVDPDYLDNPRPAYPLASRRRGEEGTVLLRVGVNTQGQATAVALEKSCGHARLDEAARRAVSGWHFLPARRAGIPVSSTVLVPVTFSLAN